MNSHFGSQTGFTKVLVAKKPRKAFPSHDVNILSLCNYFPPAHCLFIQLVNGVSYFLSIGKSHISENMLKVLDPFFSGRRIGVLVESRWLLAPKPFVSRFSNLVDSSRGFRLPLVYGGVGRLIRY